MRPPVRAVTVDLWGTLFLDSPGSDDRYKARRLTDFATILRGEGHGVAPARLDRAYQDSASYLRRVWEGGRDVPVVEHVKAILRGLDAHVADVATPDLLAALVQAYARPALLVPPAVDETARGAFGRLRAAGITLVLVSNTMRTPGATLRAILAKEGLLDVFAHTAFSDETGVRKPEPAMFTTALRVVGVAPEEAVHVGDDAVLDVQGGRAAGLRVVQVVGAAGRSAVPAPDRVITRLGELPAAVAALAAD